MALSLAWTRASVRKSVARFVFHLQAKRQLLIQRRGSSLALRAIIQESGANLVKMEYLWTAVCGFLSKTHVGKNSFEHNTERSYV